MHVAVNSKVARAELFSSFPSGTNAAAAALLRHPCFTTAAAGLIVDDAHQAYEQSVANGAKSVRGPVDLKDDSGSAVVSEVELYGDVVLRFISGDFKVRARRVGKGRGGGFTQPLLLAVLFCGWGGFGAQVVVQGG